MSVRSEVATNSYTTQQIRVPSGRCPIEFSMFWDLPCQPPHMIVCAWFREVRAFGIRRGEFLTGEAIAYWARLAYDSDEMEEIIMEYADSIGG